MTEDLITAGTSHRSPREVGGADAVVVEGLTKRYGGRAAVDNLSVYPDRHRRRADRTKRRRQDDADGDAPRPRPSDERRGHRARRTARQDSRLPQQVGALIESPAFHPAVSGIDNLRSLAVLGRRSQVDKGVSMIVVMGATGNTGAKVAGGLVGAAETVRALGRSEHKLAALKHAGAEVLVGDVADAEFLTAACHGADAVYALLATDPGVPDYRARETRQAEAIVHAVRASSVRHVVALSSKGAELPADKVPGLLLGLHDQERRLEELDGASVLLLRPVSFFENFLNHLEVIRHDGVIADSTMPDVVMPMIAARDIARVAVEALIARDWSGVTVRELFGQRDLSHAEATRILGDRMGRPDLRYVQLSYADMAEALVRAGTSETYADLYTGLTRAHNEGTVTPPPEDRNADNTTPTRFEDFAVEFAHAYQAA